MKFILVRNLCHQKIKDQSNNTKVDDSNFETKVKEANKAFFQND